MHVRDISHPDTSAQKVNVLRTLRELGVPQPLFDGIIEVCNKADLLPAPHEQCVSRPSVNRYIWEQLSFLYLIIIELTMCVWLCGHECVATDSSNGSCHRHHRRLCLRPHSHESVIFSHFWYSYFLSYGHFLHAGYTRTYTGGGCTWRHNHVGGVTAGHARHNSSNVGGVTAGQCVTTLVHYYTSLYTYMSSVPISADTYV